MVFIKSGEILIPYQKKAILCSMVFIKVEKKIFHANNAILCSMVLIKVEK